MSVCAAPTCSHQNFDGSSYYVDVDVDIFFVLLNSNLTIYPSLIIKLFLRYMLKPMAT